MKSTSKPRYTVKWNSVDGWYVNEACMVNGRIESTTVVRDIRTKAEAMELCTAMVLPANLRRARFRLIRGGKA